MFSLWPGLQGVVRYGHWTFLGIALLFALLLDLFLIVNFYWTSFITPTQRNGLLLLLFVAWMLLQALEGGKRRCYEASVSIDGKDKAYREAIVHYLRGNWFETESLILPRLKKNPRDPEMSLLLATLYRHTKRFVEAKRVLDRLCRLDGAERWYLEIDRERRLIEEEESELKDEIALNESVRP